MAVVNPNIVHGPNPYSQFDRQQDLIEKANLEMIAAERRCRAKVSSVILWPLTMLCCIPYGIYSAVTCNKYACCSYVDENNVGYCDCSTCDAGACWRPKLPPEDQFEMSCLFCNPLPCCPDQESLEHFWDKEERNRYADISERAVRVIRGDDIDNALAEALPENFPDVLREMIAHNYRQSIRVPPPQIFPPPPPEDYNPFAYI